MTKFCCSVSENWYCVSTTSCFSASAETSTLLMEAATVESTAPQGDLAWRGWWIWCGLWGWSSAKGEEIVRLIIIGELINELQVCYTCCSIVHFESADGPWKIIKNVCLPVDRRRSTRTKRAIDGLKKGRHHSRRFDFNELFCLLPLFQGHWLDQPGLCIAYIVERGDENIMTGCLCALFISVCLYRSIHLPPSSQLHQPIKISRDHDPWAPGMQHFGEQPQWKVKNWEPVPLLLSSK